MEYQREVLTSDLPEQSFEAAVMVAMAMGENDRVDVLQRELEGSEIVPQDLTGQPGIIDDARFGAVPA